MPRYDYRCQKCGETFEVKQKFSDEPLTVHDKCGGKVDRLISAPALQFKGSGWYVTDYGRSHSQPATGGSNGKSEKADTKSESKSESKGDTKTDSKPSSHPSSGDK